MSLKYGLPLIFGSIGTFFIANMFEEAPDVDIADLAPIDVVPMLDDTSIKVEKPIDTQHDTYHIHAPAPAPAPAPVFHAHVYHPPVFATPPPAPEHDEVIPPVIKPKPLPVSKPLKPSSAETTDPMTIEEALSQKPELGPKAKAASENAAAEVKVAANKRAEELRPNGLIITKPIPNPHFVNAPPRRVLSPTTTKAKVESENTVAKELRPNGLIIPNPHFVTTTPRRVLPPTTSPKSKLRVRGYSETDADLTGAPPLAPNAVKLDATPLPKSLVKLNSPLSPVSKIKLEGGELNKKELKNLARGSDHLADLYDRY